LLLGTLRIKTLYYNHALRLYDNTHFHLTDYSAETGLRNEILQSLPCCGINIYLLHLVQSIRETDKIPRT